MAFEFFLIKLYSVEFYRMWKILTVSNARDSGFRYHFLQIFILISVEFYRLSLGKTRLTAFIAFNEALSGCDIKFYIREIHIFRNTKILYFPDLIKNHTDYSELYWGWYCFYWFLYLVLLTSSWVLDLSLFYVLIVYRIVQFRVQIISYARNHQRHKKLSSFSIMRHFLSNSDRILPGLTFNRLQTHANAGRILSAFSKKGTFCKKT